jgi:hypothetical protein
MAFNIVNNVFVSFAVYADVVARDQRFFEANEGLTSTDVDSLLAQASQRILSHIKNTDWYRRGAFANDSTLGNDLRLLPAVNPKNILSKEQEFKDLNIYFAMSEYLLPKVADFSNTRPGSMSSEVVKIKFYRDAYDALLQEVLESGDWYDFSGNGTISKEEKYLNKINRLRIR